jgi:threonine dehydrogenase-like Zn-dependent dehydrogenase/glycosyltransferase involved in cell wall biosynthesis
MRARISVVIRTLNEERWVEPLLLALRGQTMRDLEIILVDSGSVDATREVAARYCDQVLDIETDSFSYGYALNFGIGRSNGDLVAILSAHTLPIHNRWIECLAAPFGEDVAGSGLALTYGKQRGNDITKLSEHTDFRLQFSDQSRRQRGSDYFCHNANALIRRDLWQQHPFDQSLPGLEDMAWAKHWMDRGLEIAYVADAAVLHIHEETWPQIYRRFRRESLAARMNGIDVPEAGRIVAREVRSLGGDIVAAFSSRRPREAGQAVLYRYWKTRGTLDGLRVPIEAASTMAAEESRTVYRALEVQAENQARMVLHQLPALRPNEVLIRVSYVGICQTDLEVLRSTLGYYRDGTARLPLVPGHEYSGVIVKRGANVDTLRVGDAVVGECILSCGICAECLANRKTACRQRREVGVVNYDGACAEYVVLPARFVHRLPEGLSLLSACSVEPLAVALKGLGRLGLRQAGETGRSRVLVLGAGALGNLCSQVANHFGHRVTTVDRLAERLKYLEGISESVLTSVPPLVKFEYVIEATGALEAAEIAMTKTHTGCNVLLLGFPYGPFRWNPEQLVAQDKRFVGSVGSDYEAFEAAIRVLPALDLRWFNDKVLDLDEWESAYRLHESKQHLKIKLKVTRQSDVAPGVKS